MRKRRRYSRDFKLEALRLVKSSGKSVAEIEHDLGITQGLLYKWRQRYQVGERRRNLSPDFSPYRAVVK